MLREIKNRVLAELKLLHDTHYIIWTRKFSISETSSEPVLEQLQTCRMRMAYTTKYPLVDSSVCNDWKIRSSFCRLITAKMTHRRFLMCFTSSFNILSHDKRERLFVISESDHADICHNAMFRFVLFQMLKARYITLYFFSIVIMFIIRFNLQSRCEVCEPLPKNSHWRTLIKCVFVLR